MPERFNATMYKKRILIYLTSLIFCFSFYVAKATDEKETKNTTVNSIEIKNSDMLNTVVMVTTTKGRGSGTIIDKIDASVEGMHEYRVLTNAHVTYQRFIRILANVNSITGKIKTNIIETQCWVMLFDEDNNSSHPILASVIAEDTKYDISIVSFESDKILPIARIADEKKLSDILVFDEVFVVGCQLGSIASPTNGIISKITKGVYSKKIWTIYGMTAQITPGSSGGGLFKKYDDHYYLIGIPYRISLARNRQMIPHLAEAISISTAVDIINENTSLFFGTVNTK